MSSVVKSSFGISSTLSLLKWYQSDLMHLRESSCHLIPFFSLFQSLPAISQLYIDGIASVTLEPLPPLPPLPPEEPEQPPKPPFADEEEEEEMLLREELLKSLANKRAFKPEVFYNFSI